MKKYAYLFLDIFLSVLSLSVAVSLIATSSFTMNLQNQGVTGVVTSLICLILPFFFFLPMRRLVPGHSFSEKIVTFGLVTTLINTVIIMRSNHMIFNHPLAVLSQQNVQCHGAYAPVTRLLGADRISKGFIKYHFPTLSFLHNEYQDSCRVLKVQSWVSLKHKKLCFNQDKKLCLYKVFNHLNSESQLSTSGHIIYTAITALEVFKEKRRREQKAENKLKISLDSGIDLMSATNYIKLSIMNTSIPYDELKVSEKQKQKVMKLISEFSPTKAGYINYLIDYKNFWYNLTQSLPELNNDELRLALVYSLIHKTRARYIEVSKAKMTSLKKSIHLKLESALEKKELTIKEYAHYKSRLKAIEKNLSYTSSL